jgi:Zn-finger nucleic acid-binding protein
MPRCPSCNTLTTRVQEDGVNLQHCDGCHGNWVGHVQLSRLVRMPVTGDAGKQPLAELAALVSESNSKKVLRCPECRVEMGKSRFHSMVPLTLDNCPKCRGHWLDAGELNLLRRLYYEMLNSTDPELIEMREKLAQANLDWEMRREQTQNMADQAKRMRILNSVGNNFSVSQLIGMLTR